MVRMSQVGFTGASSLIFFLFSQDTMCGLGSDSLDVQNEHLAQMISQKITTTGCFWSLAKCIFLSVILAVMDIDSVGTFTMCHEALKYLKKGGPGRSPSGGGSILNISATLHYTASWYQIHVSAAKVCHNFFSCLL